MDLGEWQPEDGLGSLDGHLLRLRLRLERDASASGRARRAVADWLSSAECSDDVVEEMALVTSELVTNAVIHAASAPHLIVGLHEGRLVLEVHDNTRDAPVVRTGDEGRRAGGYGLRLVEALTHRWGWESTATGKRVWVEKRV